MNCRKKLYDELSVRSDLEQQVGAVGGRADAGVGPEQPGQVEQADGLLDLARRVVFGQLVLEAPPVGGVGPPRRRCEAAPGGGPGGGAQAAGRRRRGRGR